ncbi:MAG TPA: TerC family protein [Alphaproteobacteria bacterium]|jgi:YjbE family integral membrane protein|nr:TerC family protein [Alphaproteobacteria bacterium]
MSDIPLETVSTLLQIAFIDLVLAGDNAIVVGLAVAGLPAENRRKAILIGMGGAVVLRILFSLVALSLLEIIGLTLAGGILLVWVAWKLFRELRGGKHESEAANENIKARHTLRSAVGAILLADVSMSLDNALAVAGAAEGHPGLLIFGLVLSVALMAVAAEWIARIIVKQRWLGYVGLAVVAYVAIEMIVKGTREILQAI